LRCRVLWKDGSEAAGIHIGVAKGSVPVATIWPVGNEPPADDSAAESVFALVQTDDRGRCRIGGLPAPPWHVAAWVDAQDPRPDVRLERVAGGSQDLEIRLDADRRSTPGAGDRVDVEVSVRDAISNAPVLDAYVTVDRGQTIAIGPGAYRRTGVARGQIMVT